MEINTWKRDNTNKSLQVTDSMKNVLNVKGKFVKRDNVSLNILIIQCHTLKMM
jgi:hypothetical protein